MESFEQLAKKYENMIYKIMHTLNIYKNQEEFFQLGLISLWEAQERFDNEKGSFTTYAYALIKGKFQTEMTKCNRLEERSVYPEDEFWDVIADPHSENPFAGHSLLPYCELLTANQAKWVLYTCIDGLSIKEIADIEKVSVSAVKAWRKGAKERLRKQLGQSI